MSGTKSTKGASVAPASASLLQTTTQHSSAIEVKTAHGADQIGAIARGKKGLFTSRIGMISTLIHLLFAFLFAGSTFSLLKIANGDVVTNIEIVTPWTFDYYEMMQGNITFNDTNTLLLGATQSLSDVLCHYDSTNYAAFDSCIQTLPSRIENVTYLLGRAIGAIPNDDVARKFQDLPKITAQYFMGRYGWPNPVFQYSLPGEPMAITCSVESGDYCRWTEPKGAVGAFAFCSPRAYNASWICENDVAMDVVTHVINDENGKSLYLGHTNRSELYHNPLNSPNLTGGVLTSVRSQVEYNSAIVQILESWDLVHAYSCQGVVNWTNQITVNYQVNGAIIIKWVPLSIVLMVTNAVCIVLLMVPHVILQWVYLAKSCASVIPIQIAKSFSAMFVLVTTCYGNYNVQVLSVVMSEYVNYSSIDFAWYLYCGAVMMASIVGIMSGPIIQLKFQQKLATPPYVLTIVSVVNAVIVFGLEAFVFSRYCYYAQTTDCMLSTSTSCIACLMIHRRSYFSVIIAAIGIIIGCAIITDSARKDVTVVPASNSVLQLFGAQTIYELAVSSKGGCVEVDNAGVKLDSSVLLANKLVRVSNQYVVDVSMMKCVLLYGLLPISFVRRHLDRPVLVLLAEKDRVTTSFAYVKLSDLHLSEIDEIPCTYR